MRKMVSEAYMEDMPLVEGVSWDSMLESLWAAMLIVLWDVEEWESNRQRSRRRMELSRYSCVRGTSAACVAKARV
jgi:hypothetical protein